MLVSGQQKTIGTFLPTRKRRTLSCLKQVTDERQCSAGAKLSSATPTYCCTENSVCMEDTRKVPDAPPLGLMMPPPPPFKQHQEGPMQLTVHSHHPACPRFVCPGLHLQAQGPAVVVHPPSVALAMSWKLSTSPSKKQCGSPLCVIQVHILYLHHTQCVLHTDSTLIRTNVVMHCPEPHECPHGYPRTFSPMVAHMTRAMGWQLNLGIGLGQGWSGSRSLADQGQGCQSSLRSRRALRKSRMTSGSSVFLPEVPNANAIRGWLWWYSKKNSATRGATSSCRQHCGAWPWGLVALYPCLCLCQCAKAKGFLCWVLIWQGIEGLSRT